jgi:iron complex outermembrane receptor protein
VNTSRVHVGLDGIIDVLAREWTWGVDVTRTQARQTEFANPYIDNAKLALAVGPSFYDAQGVARCGTPDNPIADCVPVDLFTGPGRFTQAMLDYLDVPVTNYKRGVSDALELRASSTLAELPAGPLAFAAGLERRIEHGQDDPDPLVASNRANGTGVTTDRTEGGYSVNEAYLEFDIPLLADKPLVRELDINAATRFSDYSQFGSTDTSRLGLRWKPFDAWLFRSTWAQGFRAPSIAEAYGGAVNTFGSVNQDPCAIFPDIGYTPPPAVAARCQAAGVPADVSPYFGSTVTYGSNPNLKPETSRSLSAGFVYSPPELPGLDLSIDWYRIQIRDAIGNLGDQAVVDACYINGDPNECARITRAEDGTISHVDALNRNIPGGIQTEGVDLAVAWKRATRWGVFDLRWNAAYVNYWGDIGKPARNDVLPDGSLARGNVVGQADDLYGITWRLRSVATLAWQHGSWGASITGRYFSAVMENCPGPVHIAHVVGDPSLAALCSEPDFVLDGEPTPRNRVGAVTYVDLQADWSAPWDARISVGARNALDRNPPLSRSYKGANSFFPDYDIPGRFLYVRYRQTF